MLVVALFTCTGWRFVCLCLPGSPPDGATADLSDGAQYSLLQTVVEACQKKRQCKFQTSPKTFGGDPCPGVRKYVEVAYKCRPCEYCLVLVTCGIVCRKIRILAVVCVGVRNVVFELKNECHPVNTNINLNNI